MIDFLSMGKCFLFDITSQRVFEKIALKENRNAIFNVLPPRLEEAWGKD